MLDDTSPSWWYEQDGQQAGPVTAAALQRLAAEGRLGPSHRVWKNGMAGWEPISAVAELAAGIQAAQPSAAAPSPPPPPLGGPAPAPRAGAGFGHPQDGSGRALGTGQPGFGHKGAGQPGFGHPGGGFGQPSGFGRPAGPQPALAGAAQPLEEISVGGVIGLSIITLGIYGMVKFYQTGKTYEALVGRTSTFTRNFWLFIGLGVGGLLVNGASGVFGLPLTIASIVFQVLTLFDALALRDEVIRQHGLRLQVTAEGTHKALYIVGILLSFVLVGLVLLLVQAAKWFGDWNAIGAALRERQPGASPSPTFR